MRKDSFDIFIEEGDKLFNYMVNNFDTMFNEKYIKHFKFGPGFFGSLDIIDELDDKYLLEIQDYLIPWIKNERNENRLFDKNNWRPFYDYDDFCYMRYGYKKLFHFKQYYFHFIIEKECMHSICDDCNLIIDKNEKSIIKYKKNMIHFELAIYGWKEEDSNIIQSGDTTTILTDDNIIPDKIWNIRY